MRQISDPNRPIGMRNCAGSITMVRMLNSAIAARRSPIQASQLLLGAIPVVVVLRRRPPRIPDRVHASAYIGLLCLVLVAMIMPLL